MAASKKDDDVLSVYKEPPKNLDAEGSFIGSLLLDGKQKSLELWMQMNSFLRKTALSIMRSSSVQL